MIKYIRKLNISLIENLVLDTVQTIDYKIENDQSDQNDYINRKFDNINQNLYDINIKQLNNPINPIIIYSNYRKLFNKTLARIYKEQVCLQKKTRHFFLLFIFI
jgi:hypothetical protein